MDWLMGKARGVSRGLMNANSPMSAPVSPECTPQSNTNLASSSTPNPGTATENGARSLGVGKEMHVANGTESHLNNYRFSPTNYPRYSDTSPSMKRRNSISSNKNSPEPSEPIFLLEKYVCQQLPISELADFGQLVEPFASMERNEWLAAHTIALFDNISTIFDAIRELCTCSHLLPSHLASGSLPSSWNSHTEGTFASSLDEEKCKKPKNSNPTPSPSSGTARQELDSALSSCTDLIQSSKIFPVRHGDPFPSDFPNYVTLICKNLLICIIHIYLAHFNHLEQLELIAHMNTVAKHFFAFTTRFSLIEEKHFDPLMGFHKVLLKST